MISIFYFLDLLSNSFYPIQGICHGQAILHFAKAPVYCEQFQIEIFVSPKNIYWL